MSFLNTFVRPKILLFMKNNEIEVYGIGLTNVASFILTPEIFNNLDIADKEAFEKYFTQFVQYFSFKKQKLLLLLSEDLIFQKMVPSGISEAEKKAFYDEVPLEPEKMRKFEVIKDENLLLLAVNKDIHETLSKILEKNGYPVDAVTPISALDTNVENNSLTQSDINNILLISDIYKYDVRSKFKVRKAPSKGLVLIALGILIANLILGVVLYFKFYKPPKAEKIISENNNIMIEETIKEVTESASVKEEVKKEDLKVQILNGTGIPGQAGKVKTLLTGIGYKDVTTANSSKEDAVEAMVIFSEKVSDANKDEVIKKLEEVFETVTNADATGVVTYDIAVVTGKELTK